MVMKVYIYGIIRYIMIYLNTLYDKMEIDRRNYPLVNTCGCS